MKDPEIVFNLFYYSTLEIITEVAVVDHSLTGTDEEKIEYLKQNVIDDFKRARKFPLPDKFKINSSGVIKNGIDFTIYRDLCYQGHGQIIFENIFTHYSATDNPLVVITPVKNGSICIEGVEKLKMSDELPPEFIHVDKQKEWYSEYIKENGFHFDQLINDDFFEAIRLLFNHKHYVSSMKLLMVCIDTLSFLEFGDVPNNFQNWLKTFANLDNLNITQDELWEFRNSMLHTTGFDSRKVLSKKVKRLMFYVSKPTRSYVKETDEGKYFSFKALIDIIGEGSSKWADSYNLNKEKFKVLIERYDRIISDKRMTYIYYENKYGT